MSHPAYKSRPLWVLCLILSLAHLLCAWDVSTEHTPGRLGIQLDFSLFRSWPSDNNGAGTGKDKAGAKRSFVFSSRLKFKQATDVTHISDKQLTSLAIEAYKEMEALEEPNKYDISKYIRPTVITALAYGDEIILSSSQKGQTSFSYGDPDHPDSRPRANRVKQQLDLCQQTFMHNVPEADRNKDRHRNNGQCGEQLVAHAFYNIHPEPDADLSKMNARVTTVQRGVGDNTGRGIFAIDPCNTPRTKSDTTGYWGCAEFVRRPEVGLRAFTLAIDENERDEEWMYDLSTLAGGLADGYPKKISLCQGE
ncbi:uncharacterized protein LY79DRAFT_661048 [Colletotrichum navitas]|uniref:Uncharacterized protein n=1 Tax=Colletotrichum navitas TaxID=681940 RepID=A0AAD8V252_9PEZI|nr:uncharacterized protein LY79DRAFT_661048 [Colletotrichum navitas]KAK1580596.1 hypothetical protein LY79DRAFT_661048 [Colletotrichum navitas]